MRNIKLTIEYDGTDFNGWQIQGQGERTVQGEIESALKTILNEEIKIIGSGRTDSGVHSLGQVANFQTESRMNKDELIRALNANTPQDISILRVKDADKDFHSQYNAKEKTYKYTILNRDTRCSINRNNCLFHPHKLSIIKIKSALQYLEGKHDFKSFQATDPSKPERGDNTIRTIKSLNIIKKGDYVTIFITADGFLYKMVRNIVGTLLEVGARKIPPVAVKQIIEAKDRNSASDTAKAHGLTLVKVTY